MTLNHFDAIVYINLAHRTDRKERLLAELERAGARPDQIHRIEAHPDPLNGHRGCGISHTQAIEFAIKEGFKNALILEDDFVFSKEQEAIDSYIDHFFSTFEQDWDVLLLGSNVIEYEPTHHPKWKQVLCAQTAHSYAVNQHYFRALEACFKFALSMMEGEVLFTQTTENLHAIDHVWKILQPHGRWYIGERTIGKQGASFSDIGLDHIKRFNPEHYP